MLSRSVRLQRNGLFWTAGNQQLQRGPLRVQGDTTIDPACILELNQRLCGAQALLCQLEQSVTTTMPSSTQSYTFNTLMLGP